MGEEGKSRRWFSFRARLIDICSSSQIIPNMENNTPREILLGLLNLNSGDIEHPQLGKIRLKVRGGRTRHYNMSFSKSPTYCEEWSARRLLEEHGYEDTMGHKKALRIRVGLTDGTQSKTLGLKQKDENLIVTSGDEEIAHWKLEKLIEKFDNLSKIIIVDYTINQGNHGEEISFSNPKLAFLNVGLMESNFEEYIRKGKISPEFRMYIGEEHEHCRSRGIKNGAVRDHGFGWRLKAPHGDEVYSVTEFS